MMIPMEAAPTSRRKRGRPPNPALRAAKHSRMLKAAVELFIERGYEHVTVEQIAQLAGQSKGAFYWYFKDKEDCLIQIIGSLGGKIETILSRELGKGQTARERLIHVTNFRNWEPREFCRYALLADSMIYSRSASVRALGVQAVRQIYQSLLETLRGLGRAAAEEAGWTREQVAAFDFDFWAWGCLATYAGSFEFINQKYFTFPCDEARLGKAIHAAYVTPIIGAFETPRRDRAVL